MDPRARILAAIDARAPRLIGLARQIHAYPELKFQEHKAAEWITSELEHAGVQQLERRTGALDTAFRGSTGRAGPRVAILAEYDALPEIGHACGHNLIAAAATGAFLGLHAIADALPGQVELVGTPAEEGGGGKIKLLEAGVFQGLDAALMFHPFDRDVLALSTLASAWIDLEFKGTIAHAAAAPWDGRSALSGVIQTFNLIDAQRLHFRDGVRVHGIITDGGKAVNVIPERAAAAFNVRARKADQLPAVTQTVERCARAAALATSTEVQVKVRAGYRDMRNNFTLARRFGAHLESLGRTFEETDPDAGLGSTDMGDVSYAVPAIHPYLAICAEGAALCHQHAFTAHSASSVGMDTMLTAARAMALLAYDVLADEELRGAALAEFEGVEATART